ncbi:MAG: NADH-quinone oxidoreductase subunit L [Maricaulaceae bacterium]
MTFAALALVFGPLIAAALAGLLQKPLGDRGAQILTTSSVCLSALLAVIMAFNVIGGGYDGKIVIARWFDIGDFTAPWALRVDPLSAVMFVVVTSVSALVHIYSWGYMSHDPHRARFFAYLSLFTFAMLMLVSADNFLQLFFGWEGVGLASYLLIGFWYKKTSANDAAIKAFVTNRVGDVGFALGIMTVFVAFGSVEFDPVFRAIEEGVRPELTVLGVSGPALEIAGVLLFIGAMGKAAQFFLHVWLPDAMEGPTPVSALIHAATMVTAGVFLVCRASPIYEYAPYAAGLVTIVGAVTALYAATVGLAQNDIKRVVAYSTCSQLGYMFFAAGIGAYQAAMFHLFTHAFFKALLFLGAGSVIHGLHDEQDMRRMGGLRKALPYTYAVMLIGTLALTGVGLPLGDLKIGFAGFYSKDTIVEAAYAAGHEGVAWGYLAFWLGVIAAGLTSFYSWRLMLMTFHGPYKGDPETLSHAHESPWVMMGPLVVLSLGALFAGLLFYDAMVYHGVETFWREAIAVAPDNHVLEAAHHVPTWVKFSTLSVTLVGFLVAIWAYGLNHDLGARIAAANGPLHRFLSRKWYFDELYSAVFVRGAKGLGDLLWKVGDQKIIDRGGPNGAAQGALLGARRLVKLQTGYLYHYAFVMLLGAAGLATWMLARGS